MFVIGEKVVYGISGIFEISDIRDETVLGAAHKYYVLKPIVERNDSLIFVPVDNEKLTSAIRYPLSRKAADDLIRSIKDIEPAPWQKDSRRRTDEYKKLLETGDHVSIISVIKSIHKNQQSRLAEGKKGFLSDDNTMKKAEKLLYSELSFVLELDENEIIEYISKVCEGDEK